MFFKCFVPICFIVLYISTTLGNMFQIIERKSIKQCFDKKNYPVVNEFWWLLDGKRFYFSAIDVLNQCMNKNDRHWIFIVN